jgi:hypothetical protein
METLAALAAACGVPGAKLWGAIPLPEAGGPVPEMAATGLRRTNYIIGADISWVQQREDSGTRYSDYSLRRK